LDPNHQLKQMAKALANLNRLVASLPDEEALYDGICRIAVDECGMSHAMVGIPDRDGWIHVKSARGKHRDALFDAKISVYEDRQEGRGIFGRAFRASSPIVENRLPDLPEMQIWRTTLSDMGTGASAVFPFYRAGNVHGCLSVHATSQDFFTPEYVDLLKGMVISLSFGLDNIDRRMAQTLHEETILTIKNYYRALGEVNEFLVHIPSPQALFQKVCDTLYSRGDPKGAVIGIVDSKTDDVVWTAFAGLPSDWVYSFRLTVRAERPEGQTMTGLVLRTGKPMILNDYIHHPVGQTFRAKFEEQNIRSAAVYPLHRSGKPVGVLITFSQYAGFFGREMDQLLGDLSQNISFSVDNYDRKIEQGKSEQTIFTLKNYYRALSRINRLVANVPPPEELFKKTCEILHESEETSIVTIGEIDQKTGLLVWNHVTGPESEWVQGLRIPVIPPSAIATPATMSQRIFQERKGLVVNDYMNDIPDNALKPVFKTHGIQSAAMFPVERGGRLFGVISVVSHRVGFFNPEISDLLDEVSRNLSFALDNYDRERERRSQEERALFLSLHDPLTGLPNRRLFYDRLDHARRGALRYGNAFSVGILDLDGFKDVNDRLGHKAGDRILIAVSDLIKTLLRDSDTVARLGGDEFGIILSELPTGSTGDNSHPAVIPGLDTTLSRILEGIRGIRDVDGAPVHISGCLGVTVFPRDKSEVDQLVINADHAMYAVKKSGKDGWKIFPPILDNTRSS